ncbi:MAG: FtsX-like permease family protein [Candidatus Omnitrophica bacterium]|nr:FtsX-like permease family protein [Candidatus Omnitrophota bacterium]
MFWRILFDSVVRRKKRKTLAVLAVWLGISLIVGLGVLCLDTGDKMNLELRSFGANIKVRSISSSIPVTVAGYELDSFKDANVLSENDFPKLKEIFWRNNITGIVPRLWVEGTMKGTIDGKKIPVLGLWLSRKIPVGQGEECATGASHVYKHWKLEGRWPKEDEAACLAGSELAENYKIEIGDRLEISASKNSMLFTVSGIISSGGREDSAVLASLRLVQGLAGLEGKVSEADISALTTPENQLAEKYRVEPKSLTPAEYERWYCTPYPENIAREIQETIPNSTARVIRRISETQGTVLTRIQGLVFFLGLITFVSCSLSLIGILASIVSDRRSEIALFQAIGAGRAHIGALFFTEIAFLGILGGILGGLTGSWIGRQLIQAIFSSEASPHFALILLSPLLGLMVAWLGSLWPVRRALNQDTARALHES